MSVKEKNAFAVKLGIYEILDSKRGTRIEFAVDGGVVLWINQDTPIIEALSDFDNIPVDSTFKERYDPSKAGVFKNHINKRFGLEKKLDIKKILGEK